ncbi:MAG TPA: hypothetical protein VK846_14710, partial [Candidatus Limnocylindria bacterium]|nr:hypothetical protein [Candidatus Limnocylindria bacterium]
LRFAYNVNDLFLAESAFFHVLLLPSFAAELQLCHVQIFGVRSITSASPPVARFKFVNGVIFPSELIQGRTDSAIFISTNGRTATITLDGSASSDPDGDPISFFGVVYYDEPDIHLAGSANPVVSFEGRLGDDRRSFRFYVVSHSSAPFYPPIEYSEAHFDFDVVTPADAAFWLIDDLNETEEDLPEIHLRHRPALFKALRSASERLRQGKLKKGIRSLRRFQSLIRVQRRHLSPQVTHAFISYTQAVIDAAKQSHSNLMAP